MKQREVGYWRDRSDPLGFAMSFLPDPKVNRGWLDRLVGGHRAEFLQYIGAAPIVESWMGWSDCRICSLSNGTADLGDDVYVWPEGLIHYVRDHDVELPEDFTAHVLSRLVIHGTQTWKR